MNPIVGRLVPLVAVAAANCINIPLMRRQELQKGITLVDDNYNSLNVESRKAAIQGISAVIASRIAMATPGMGKISWMFLNDFDNNQSNAELKCQLHFHAVLTPIVVQKLANKGFFRRYPWANAPIQTGLVGFILIFATPLGCAFFSQMASIKVIDCFHFIFEISLSN